MVGTGSEEATEEERERGATVSWFELFYDLVVVAAVALCNDAYLTRPSWGTAITALLSIAALSWVWFMTTVFNNVFPGDDLIRRLLLLVQMGCIVVAALAVDQFDGLSNSTGLVAYGLSILIIGVLVLRERGGARQAKVIKGGLLPIGFTALICLLGALLPSDYGGAVVALALAVSIGAALTARLDRAGVTTVLRVDHLRERRGLFILIILGEGFTSLVTALHEIGSIPRGGIFALTFLLSFALWWIYFDGTFSERDGSIITHWRLSLLAHLTLIYGMAGTLDLLVLVTVQEEQNLGDSSLMYLAVCLATVFFSFALLGFTARSHFSRPGWVQVGSGVLILAVGATATAGDDRSVTAVTIVAGVLVVGNAVLSVWVASAAKSDGWRATLTSVMGRSGSDDNVLG